jgi:hypothetical protein
MSIINTIHVRTSLPPKEFLDLFIDCLPDEAKNNGIRFDTTNVMRGIVDTLVLTPDMVDSNDTFNIRIANIFGFMPTIEMAAKYRDYDADNHYFQAAFELIRRENLDLSLHYFDRLVLVNCSEKLAISRYDLDRIKEAMGDNPIPCDVKDFPAY